MDSWVTLQTKIYQHLQADDGTACYQDTGSAFAPTYPLVGTLSGGSEPAYSGILEGGLWDKPIKQAGDGVTEYAFYQTSRGHQIRPCGYVRAPSRLRHRQASAIPGAYLGNATVYLYADRSATGKKRLELACRRIRQLTEGWSFVSSEGPVVFVSFVDAVEPYDTEEFPGAIATYCRLELTGRYANEV